MTAATMRHDVAGKVRRLAARVETTHPAMGVHNHLRDAARALDSGNTEGAQRHLRAAVAGFTPQSLYRNGHLDDQAHEEGKQHMMSTHRMILLVKDSEDTAQREKAAKVMNAPATNPIGRPDGTAAGPAAPINTVGQRLPARNWRTAGQQSAGPALMSVTDQAQIYAIAIELSTQTPALASVPHPFGKPGGLGLWDVKGMELPPYIQNIARALLRTGRAKTLSQAIAMAKAATARWAAGKNTSPEVRAASAGTNAQWDAKRAIAHTHTATSGQHVDLVGPRGYSGQAEILLFNPNHGPNGQFTTPQNAQQGKGKQGKGKLNTKASQMSHAQRAKAKGQLLAKAHADTQKASQIRAQIHALIAQMRSARGGSSGKTVASSSSTKASSGTTSASSTAASKSSTSAASTKAGASSKPTSARAQASQAQFRQKIQALRQQMHQLLAQASQARAQAKTL